MAVVLIFARAGKAIWTVPDGLGWFRYDFSEVLIMSVPELRAPSFIRGRRSATLSGAFLTTVTLQHTLQYVDDSMNRELAEAT